MIIKVCGLRDYDNIENIDALCPDMVGMIFYEKSLRYVSENYPPTSAKRVGVFVNAEIDYIKEKAFEYDLDYIQLHGGESVSFCNQVKNLGFGVIKVFSINAQYDFKQCAQYEDASDYFLFDTQTNSYGGSGEKFDWDRLDSYKGQTPFLLSGGITTGDERRIKKISHAMMAGVDINSGFELQPALKDINKVALFMKKLK